MAVNLQQKVFLSEETLGLSACPTGTATVCGVGFHDLQVLMKWESSGADLVLITVHQLETDSEMQSLGMGCTFQQIVQRGR